MGIFSVFFAMRWMGNSKRRGVVFLLSFVPVGLLAQTITVQVNVPVSFVMEPPAIPGDPPQMVFENTMGDVELDMNGGGGAAGRRWYVTVQKSGSGWHGDLEIAVRRDSGRTDVIDGANYVTIPDGPTAAYFFRSNNVRRVRNLQIQHRVTLGSLIPPGTYTTTITYTIIRGNP